MRPPRLPPIALARPPAWFDRLLDRLLRPAREAPAEAPEPRGVVVPLVRPEDAAEWRGLDDFLGGLLELLRGLFDFDSAHVFLASDDGRSLVQRAYTARGERPVRLASIRVGAGLVGWVAERGRAIAVGDLKTHGRPTGYSRPGIVSFAAAPIVAGGKTLGVLAVDHVEPNAFPSPRTEAALAAVAAQVGRILAAEGALAEAREAAAAAAAAAEIARPVAAAETLDAAAEALVSALARSAETTAVGCFLRDEAGGLSLRAHVGWADVWGANIRRRSAEKIAALAIEGGRPIRFGAPASRQPPGIAVPIPAPGAGSVGAVVVEAGEEAVKTLEPILVGAVAEIGASLVRVYRRIEAEREAARARRLADDIIALAEAPDAAAFWAALERILGGRIAPLKDGLHFAAYRLVGGAWRLEAAAGAPAAPRLRAGEGLVGWAAAAGRALAVADLSGESRGVPIAGAGSILLVPLGAPETEAVVAVAGPAGTLGPSAVEAVEDLRAPLAALIRRLPPASTETRRAEAAA